MTVIKPLRDWSQTDEMAPKLYELAGAIYYMAKLADSTAASMDGPHFTALPSLEQLYIETATKALVNDIRAVLRRPQITITTGLRPSHGILGIVEPRQKDVQP